MDSIDLGLIRQLQKQSDIALTELSRRLGISKTTCWNRLQRLDEKGIIAGKYTWFDRTELGLSVVVFLSITVGRHSPEWVNRFTAVVERFPEIVEAHRLTGEGADYQLKVVCPDIDAYRNSFFCTSLRAAGFKEFEGVEGFTQGKAFPLAFYYSASEQS